MGRMKDDLYAAMEEGNPAATRLWRERFVQPAASPTPMPAGPTFESGDMWTVYGQTDLFVITTNSTIKANGTLVMGRGIARQARDRMRGLDRSLGQQIATTCGSLGEYRLLTAIWHNVSIGALQVKYHSTDRADLALIARSITALRTWIDTTHPHRVDMVFPGIGNGTLRRNDVLPLLQSLPALVHVWELPPAAPVERAREVGGDEHTQTLPSGPTVASAPPTNAIPLIVGGNVVGHASDAAEANRWLHQFEASL